MSSKTSKGSVPSLGGTTASQRGQLCNSIRNFGSHCFISTLNPNAKEFVPSFSGRKPGEEKQVKKRYLNCLRNGIQWGLTISSQAAKPSHTHTRSRFKTQQVKGYTGVDETGTASFTKSRLEDFLKSEAVEEEQPGSETSSKAEDFLSQENSGHGQEYGRGLADAFLDPDSDDSCPEPEQEAQGDPQEIPCLPALVPLKLIVTRRDFRVVQDFLFSVQQGAGGRDDNVEAADRCALLTFRANGLVLPHLSTLDPGLSRLLPTRHPRSSAGCGRSAKVSEVPVLLHCLVSFLSLVKYCQQLLRQALSYHILRQAFGLQLLRAETQVRYAQACCRLDFTCEVPPSVVPIMNNRGATQQEASREGALSQAPVVVGVSVTRAYNHKGPFRTRHAKRLLGKKLMALESAWHHVESRDRWNLTLLHVIASTPRSVRRLRKVWTEMTMQAESANTDTEHGLGQSPTRKATLAMPRPFLLLTYTDLGGINLHYSDVFGD